MPYQTAFVATRLAPSSGTGKNLVPVLLPSGPYTHLVNACIALLGDKVAWASSFMKGAEGD